MDRLRTIVAFVLLGALAAGAGAQPAPASGKPTAGRPAAAKATAGRGDAEVRALLDDYIRLYARETLPEWRTLFLPSFTATFTNDDGSTTSRNLEEFYQRQEKYFATGRPIREELANVRIERTGRLADARADFTLYDGPNRRDGRLMLLFVEERGRLRIAALTFTYHLEP